MIARLAPALVAGLLAASPAAAQEAGEPERSDDNSQITVYGWLAGASGSLRPIAGAPRLEFDNSFGEVLGDLDAAFFASAQLRRGEFVAVADLSYASLSRDGVVPPGIPASGRVRQLAITAMAGARVTDNDALTVDLLAGARLWNVGGQVAVPLAGIALAPDRTFVDPVIGARFGAPVAPRLSALLHADIGGFGIGSDFTYQVVGTANYRASDRFTISAGWRHLHLDYDKGGTVFDGSQTGPIIGATFQF